VASTSRRRSGAGIALLLAGGLAGAIVTIGIGRVLATGVPAAPTSSVRLFEVSADPGDRIEKLSFAQRELMDRVVALEHRGISEQPEPAPTPEMPPSVATQVDPAAVQESTRVRHERWRSAHAEEPRDAAWSRAKSTVFNDRLGDRARASGFTVLEVDCRTTWCRADLEWPSYPAALNTYSQALHVLVDGCESAVLLERPSDPTQRYRSSAFYNCEADRLQAP
jgi:hypothetical protein